MADFIINKFNESIERNSIQNSLYDKYNVKKGLRNKDKTGVLVGLTKISDVHGYSIVDGKKVDDEGHLYYRGIDIFDIVGNKNHDIVEGFEELSYLLLFGVLPTRKELDEFKDILSSGYELHNEYLQISILKHPSNNIMNKIQRALLMLYSRDMNPDDDSVENTLVQGINIISKLPAIICYSYQGKAHTFDSKSMYIHHPKKGLSIAENFLRLIRKDAEYTKLEAEVLDLALMVHADHGGGNNSTFTNIVISSTGTDIYSALSGAVGSLKGPRHGGANRKVVEMMDLIINEIGYSNDLEEIRKIVNRILDNDFYDNKGLIYGVGHAVYTKSDPRSKLLKEKSRELAIAKGMIDEFVFYDSLEKVAIEELTKRKPEGFNICTNVDFYSGFVYSLLKLPQDVYTPLFVLSRMVGWLAHNIENKLFSNKIIRPASKYVGDEKRYIKINERVE